MVRLYHLQDSLPMKTRHVSLITLIEIGRYIIGGSNQLSDRFIWLTYALTCENRIYKTIFMLLTLSLYCLFSNAKDQ